MISYIIGWVFTGLMVGALARFMVPGRQDMSMATTVLLGIVGALVGGFVSWALFGPRGDVAGYDVAVAWPGWIMAILGGIVVLWGYLSLNRQSF